MLGTMQSGGALLDQGMYGCVFTSSLHCKDKKQQPVEDSQDKEHPPLSKIIRTDDAEVEYQISSLIRKIPLWKNYFAVAESICEPANKQTDKEFRDCPVLEDDTISNFRILSMTYQGVSLQNAQIRLSSFDIMRFTSHLIEAGALLTLHGIVHRDLHQGNILIDRHSVPRIIDFNLSVIVKQPISESSLLHKHTIMLGQEPPDSTLVNAVAYGHDGSQVIEALLQKKRILTKISSLLGISKQDMKASLYRFYRQSKSVKNGDSVEWCTTYWRTIDSWAIGVNIVDLVMKLSIMSQFSIESYSKRLFPILRKMCAVSPLERIDCVQALHQLNPNHFIIQRYGQEWLKKVGSGA